MEVGQGSEVERFTVHESLLRAGSEYFRHARNENWNESDTRVITLADCDPAIFALYLNHVRTRQFPTMTNTREELLAMEPAMARSLMGKEVYQLAQVYVLAERLQEIMTRSAVTKVLVRLYHATNAPLPSTRTVDLVYRKTPEGRPPRRLLADLGSSVPMTVILAAAPFLPREFLDDLSALVDRQRVIQRPQVLELLEFRHMAPAS